MTVICTDGNNSDFIEFASTPNGLISIELKNIGHIENRR